VSGFERAREILEAGISGGVFPGCAVDVGSAASAAWQDAFGRLTYEDDAAPARVSTVYDLASLTKPVATATLAMRLVEARALALDDALAAHNPLWRGGGREPVTLRDLLEHASGLPAWAPLWQRGCGAEQVAALAARTPLEYEPRTRSVYSDLGFILLGAALERTAGAPLDRQFAQVAASLAADAPADFVLTYRPSALQAPSIAPTRVADSRGRLLVGEVDDDNAWAMGGVAGHAGLFGTAGAVGAFARAVLRALAGDARAERQIASAATLRAFLAPSGVPGSSRSLGWDLMRPSSSCGSRMPASAFGHTGFTGTSLWIDPAGDFYAVLLSNRVYPKAGPGDAMQALRRAFHDAVAAAIGE